jgi:hypothetical protein
LINISFEPDERALADDAAAEPAHAAPEVLSETYFLMPVHFCIDEVELLSPPSQPATVTALPSSTVLVGRALSAPVPLVAFAVGVHRAIGEMRAGDKWTCYLAEAGELRLERQADSIRIVSTVTGATATVAVAELREAAEQFRSRVRDFLRARVPGMESHPSWSAWFGA